MMRLRAPTSAPGGIRQLSAYLVQAVTLKAMFCGRCGKLVLELAKLRAVVVREALVTDGVAAERIALVKPAEVIVGQGHDADARRVDIVLR